MDRTAADFAWVNAIIEKAQNEPGLADLAQLNRIAAEAQMVSDYMRESSVVYMVSASTTTTARVSSQCLPGAN